MTSYEKIIMEYFDIDDDYTRQTLLSVNENDQGKVLNSLTSKLYQSIMDKVEDIDFGSIPDSKGDITQVQNYEKLIETLSIVKSILVEYHQDTSTVDTITLAIENVQNRKDLFEKGFNLNLHLPITLYNTIVLSIYSATHLIIATSIEFIKDAGSQDYNVKFDKVAYAKSKDHLLFTNLKRFNTACQIGEVDKSLDYIMKEGSRQLLGADTLGIVSVMAGIGIIISIIPLMRELIFFFFNTKQQVSDHFGIQSEILYANSELVKQNTTMNRTDKERKEIARKQAKMADTFKKWSNKLAVDAKTAESKAKTQMKQEDRKYKVKKSTNTQTQEEPTQSIDTSPDNTSSIF